MEKALKICYNIITIYRHTHMYALYINLTNFHSICERRTTNNDQRATKKKTINSIVYDRDQTIQKKDITHPLYSILFATFFSFSLLLLHSVTHSGTVVCVSGTLYRISFNFRQFVRDTLRFDLDSMLFLF